MKHGGGIFPWKVTTDVRGTSAYKQVRGGKVAGTLRKTGLEARANGLGVMKS